MKAPQRKAPKLGTLVTGLWLAAAALPAQDRLQFQLRSNQEVRCTVEVQAFFGRQPGYGWLCVDVAASDGERHRVQLGYRSLGGGDVGADRSIDLPAGSPTARVFVPLLRSSRSTPVLSVAIDGSQAGRQQLNRFGGSGNASLLLVSDASITAMKALAEAAADGGRGARPQLVDIEPSLLPPDWPMLSSFDAVLVDGRARVGGPAQEALRRYAAAGGVVVVGHGSSLPPGSLRERLAAADGAHGLGAIMALADFTPSRGDVQALARLLARSMPVPSSWYEQLRIPGLGDIPGQLFVLVIVLFALAVGPANFWFLRRRRQPLLALVTVPVLGFGCTLAILFYGMFHDGFDLRGAQHSFSVLDQRQHEAAAVATRTVFAGLAPGPLQVGSAVFVDSREDAQRSLVLDADRGTVAGSVLPSRQATVLVSAQHGVARQRLRCRQRAGGGYEALGDGGLQLPAKWLLRDLDGDWFVGHGKDLQPVAAAAGKRALQELRGRIGIDERQLVRDESNRYLRPREVGQPPGYDFDDRFPGDQLPPGSYLLVDLDAVPWLEQFGLDVTWQRSQHAVLGLLAPEDFLP